jgi:TetR/AcrR family transcriptional regulator, lmrAB and yxaGH operons repressor
MRQVSPHYDALISTATRLFSSQGYHGTGLTQLLSESGAPKGSFYYLFPQGKEELAADVVRQGAEFVGGLALKAITSSKTAETAAQTFAKSIANWFKKSGYSAGCPVTAIALDMTPEGPLVSAASREAHAEWIDLWRNALERENVPPLKSAQLATAWIALLEGAWILSRTQQSTQPFAIAADAFVTLIAAAKQSL